MKTIIYIIEMIEKLVNIPSPSGYTADIMRFVKKEAEKWEYTCEYTRKGGLLICIPGQSEEVIGLSAHVDTLGAMVRSISSSGTLKITSVGGFMMESIEGSYCTIHTREGKKYCGTILTTNPSVHVFDNARKQERNERNMEIRIEEKVKTKEDVKKLGIQAGDYISFDPAFRYLQNGYITSRHLDDKASVGILLGLLKELNKTKQVPEKTVKILISNYEEVGFGASWIPEDITELLAIDMGAVGDDLEGDETRVSICAKDSTGPYDYDMTTRLIEIAKKKKLDYAVDIFPHYGSDVSAALKGGNNICGALIGPGVQASHSIERTHKKGLENTYELIKGYLKLN